MWQVLLDFVLHVHWRKWFDIFRSESASPSRKDKKRKRKSRRDEWVFILRRFLLMPSDSFFIILFLPFVNFYGDIPRNCSFLKRRRAINLCGWDSSIPPAPLNSNNLRCSHQVSFVQFDFVQRGCENEFNRCLAFFMKCNFNVSTKRKRRSVLGMRNRKKNCANSLAVSNCSKYKIHSVFHNKIRKLE